MPTAFWLDLFKKRFPESDHERMSKCDCSSDEEHEAHWKLNRDDVFNFIRTLHTRWQEEAHKQIRMYALTQEKNYYPATVDDVLQLPFLKEESL